jgi:hypothetical protein
MAEENHEMCVKITAVLTEIQTKTPRSVSAERYR